MYKISEVSKKMNIAISTLRYYEDLGILQPKRSIKGYREFEESDLEWLQFILNLKRTGMSIKDIQAYAKLRAIGDSTIEERLKLLACQEAALWEQMREVQAHLVFLKNKTSYYQKLLVEINSPNKQ